MNGICDICKKKPSAIHLSDVDNHLQLSWCLDCAPARYAEDVTQMRAHAEWQEGWEAEMNIRKATGKIIPSWRVPSSSAFMAGWRASLRFWVEREEKKNKEVRDELTSS